MNRFWKVTKLPFHSRIGCLCSIYTAWKNLHWLSVKIISTHPVEDKVILVPQDYIDRTSIIPNGSLTFLKFNLIYLELFTYRSLCNWWKMIMYEYLHNPFLSKKWNFQRQWCLPKQTIVIPIFANCPNHNRLLLHVTTFRILIVISIDN